MYHVPSRFSEIFRLRELSVGAPEFIDEHFFFRHPFRATTEITPDLAMDITMPLTHRLPVLLLFLVCLSASPSHADRVSEAFEIGRGRTADLPRGKEADGIVGDFVLRNSKIEAVISGNLHLRRPNFRAYGSDTTPGCLYDLCLRDSDNDQITGLAPGELRGLISDVSVMVTEASRENDAAVVLVNRTAARGDGLAQKHAYILRPGAFHLEIISKYENQTAAPMTIHPSPRVVGLSDEMHAHNIVFHDAQDPMDRQGYAYTLLAMTGGESTADGVLLKPGGSLDYVIAVAPGHSPAHAFSTLARVRKSDSATGTLRGSMLEADSRKPATTAALRLLVGSRKDGDQTLETWLPAYPLDDGSFDLTLPPGDYLYVVQDLGRTQQEGSVSITADKVTPLLLSLDRPSSVVFDVKDRKNPTRSLPCKVQFFGVDDTPDPDLGVPIRAHGCNHQYHSETGDFEVAIAPGEYRVIVTRGIEYDHHESIIALAPGRQVKVEARLERVVDTTGWISTDFHNHSTPSGDNYCGVDDRIINLAAEQVEFAPATEHNRIYDWAPHIAKLGLEREIATCTGIELTGPGTHLNSFPMTPVPFSQDNGAPVWVQDPRINAIVLRDHQGGDPERWVHVNHPDFGQIFRDRDNDGIADGGFAGLVYLIDAAETLNFATSLASRDETRQASAEILVPTATTPFQNQQGKQEYAPNRSFRWLQLLNQGLPLAAVSVSDAHTVFDMGVGGWRTYVPSSTDDPAAVDFREIIRNSKAGRMVLSNGPFLEVTGEDGALPGGTTRGSRVYHLDVRVQSNSWVKVDRVAVLVNGRGRADLDFHSTSHPDLFRTTGAERFRGRIAVPLNEDAHLIVVATSEEADLSVGYGKAWQSAMRPCAYNNPIFVDIDGDGFKANGDTLGYPLPVGPLRTPK
jgi:hypothetical protein